jgi:O-antigen ligase
MPPFIALLLSAGVFVMLLVSERRMNPDVSNALWIPFLWMFFIGTRFPSQWMDIGSYGLVHADEYLEGSPIDQGVFLFLYAAAIAVLLRRRVPWSEIVAANVWIAAFLLYGLLSVAWSDYPWTALKRFTKVVEHLVMVLVVLTDKKPLQAMDALFRRFLATGLLFSVLILKYYPELGRAFDNWTGQAFNTGVTSDKNALGHICLLGTIFYTSSLLSPAHRRIGQPVRGRTLADLAMLAAAFWLLNLANAKTALVCSLLGMLSIVVLSKTTLSRNPKAIVFWIISLVALAAALEWAFNIREIGIEALDRNPTLTDRVYVWEDVLAMPNNPVLGTGFESFWLGTRVELLWQKYWWQPNQAHNGYIETYINLGAVGLLLLLVMIGAGFARSLRQLQRADPFGSIRFSLIISMTVLNYTDATFKALHILYFTFFLIVLATERVPAPGPAPQLAREAL